MSDDERVRARSIGEVRKGSICLHTNCLSAALQDGTYRGYLLYMVYYEASFEMQQSVPQIEKSENKWYVGLFNPILLASVFFCVADNSSAWVQSQGEAMRIDESHMYLVYLVCCTLTHAYNATRQRPQKKLFAQYV